MRILVALALVCAMGGTVAAQWLSVPVPGTPRTPDGKPDLKAPTPRTADGRPNLSGIWRVESYRWVNNLLPEGQEAPFQPWAEALYKKRVATLGYDVPTTFCLPHAVPDGMLVNGHPFKIIQTPDTMIHLYESMHMYRQIHTDGRALPVDPDPAWYGYSIGRWEGDTFVVETNGFRDGAWFTNRGHPRTDAAKVTERFRRVNFGYMELVATIDDPKAYTRPWTSDTIRFFLEPDTELLEHMCENNRDASRLLKIWEPDKAPAATGSGR